MVKKNYIGCCGSCIHCDLHDSYTALYSTSFKCTRNNYSVKADEKTCNRYELDRNRTNDMIAKYDK